MDVTREPAVVASEVSCPFSVRIDEIAGMLNFELADHPVYDGGELQWFDDPAHGTGMLAFLSRREGRRVDYYAERGLRIDRAGYEIGGGIGSWTELDFEVARFVVAEDGVAAEVRFTDVDGRPIEIRVDDRDGHPRRPAALLAPVSAAIERPVSLLLVWLPRFDLVRAGGAPPVIRIDGVDATIGRLPGARLHRRHLVKYAAPVVAVELNRAHDGAQPTPPPSQQVVLDDAGGVAQVVVEGVDHRARLRLDPALPDVARLPDGKGVTGRWNIEVDDGSLTGGGWSATREGARVRVGLDVDERWQPGRLPWLMRLVTTVVPVFRRWPTTYRWSAEIDLGDPPSMTAQWQRTTPDRGNDYRRATTSGRPTSRTQEEDP